MSAKSKVHIVTILNLFLGVSLLLANSPACASEGRASQLNAAATAHTDIAQQLRMALVNAPKKLSEGSPASLAAKNTPAVISGAQIRMAAVTDRSQLLIEQAALVLYRDRDANKASELLTKAEAQARKDKNSGLAYLAGGILKFIGNDPKAARTSLEVFEAAHLGLARSNLDRVNQGDLADWEKMEFLAQANLDIQKVLKVNSTSAEGLKLQDQINKAIRRISQNPKDKLTPRSREVSSVVPVPFNQPSPLSQVEAVGELLKTAGEGTLSIDERSESLASARSLLEELTIAAINRGAMGFVEAESSLRFRLDGLRAECDRLSEIIASESVRMAKQDVIVQGNLIVLQSAVKNLAGKGGILFIVFDDKGVIPEKGVVNKIPSSLDNNLYTAEIRAASGDIADVVDVKWPTTLSPKSIALARISQTLNEHNEAVRNDRSLSNRSIAALLAGQAPMPVTAPVLRIARGDNDRLASVSLQEPAPIRTAKEWTAFVGSDRVKDVPNVIEIIDSVTSSDLTGPQKQILLTAFSEILRQLPLYTDRLVRSHLLFHESVLGTELSDQDREKLASVINGESKRLFASRGVEVFFGNTRQIEAQLGRSPSHSFVFVTPDVGSQFFDKGARGIVVNPQDGLHAFPLAGAIAFGVKALQVKDPQTASLGELQNVGALLLTFARPLSQGKPIQLTTAQVADLLQDPVKFSRTISLALKAIAPIPLETVQETYRQALQFLLSL